MILKRGKYLGDAAQKATEKFLTEENNAIAEFFWHRYTDSKAAGRIVRAAPSDYQVVAKGLPILLEVKESEAVGLTLPVSKIRQMPLLRKHILAGGISIVLVYFFTDHTWRIMNVDDMPKIYRGSFDFSVQPAFAHPRDALIHIIGDYRGNV